MNKGTYRKAFEPDSGTLLLIVVFNVDLKDWQAVLDFASSKFLVVYSEDGVEKQLPSIESIFQTRAEKSIMLEIMLPGFTVNCHFTSIDRIEMNVLPEDVNSSEKADSVLQLMLDLANLLSNEVFLIPEFGSASEDKLRQLALCVATPSSSSVRWLSAD